jgi:hypothetical protein
MMGERRKHAKHCGGPPSAIRLAEEIALLERRLQQIGPDGDCAYEKALIRFLEQQLGMRREMLSSVE